MEWDILGVIFAEVAELAYAYASGAYGVTLEGSTPSFRTYFLLSLRYLTF